MNYENKWNGVNLVEKTTSFHVIGSQRNTLPASSGGSRFLYSCGLSSFSRNNNAAAYEAKKSTISACEHKHYINVRLTGRLSLLPFVGL